MPDNTTNNADLFLNLYPINPPIIDHGKGCYLYDTNGKKYLDFAAGIAVCALGHAHPDIIRVGKDQFEKLTMSTGSYLTQPRIDAARILIENSCMDRLFFCNSGAEAVEAAIKTVHKWAHEHKGPEAHEIIAFHGSFHGRTIGAASLTSKQLKQQELGPYMPGVHFANFNDLDSVKALVNKNTAAIFLEPVQGEGGIVPADIDFLKGLRTLCDEQNIILVFDEIQAGMGRLGTLFAYQSFGVEPDIITSAKGLGGGVPIGAMLARAPYSDSLTPGTHGTTYGGNPLATRIAHTVLNIINTPEFLDTVKTSGALLMAGLHKLKAETNFIEDVRGMGLMVGIDTVFDTKKLLPALRDHGMLATMAGANTLRLTPPLIAGENEINEAIEIIHQVLREEAA